MTQGEQPMLGSGDGRSSTTKATIFAIGSELGLLADMGGWNDSDRRFTGEEMAEKVSTQLALHDVQHVRFLVFDSMSGDTSQLRNSIVELVKGFGEATKNSIIVIASKMDRADPDEIEGRLKYMTETMQELGIDSRLLAWQNKALSDDQLECQVSDLWNHVESTPACTTASMQGIRTRIEVRARKLYNDQPKTMRSVEVKVNETFLKKVKEPRTEKYWDKTFVITSRLDHEMEEAPVPAVVGYALTLGIGALASHLSTYKKEVLVEKTRTIDDWKTYEDTRVVKKWVDVEDPPKPLEDFWLQAREQIGAEIHERYALNEKTLLLLEY